MGKYINGYGFPIFRIFNTSNKITEQLELPWTDEDGLVETLSEITVRKELYNGTTDNYTRGFKINFILSYNRYLDKSTVKKIRSIIEAQKAGYRINFIPRNDLVRRNFDVVLVSDKIDLGILKGGVSAIGNNRIVLELVTKYMQDSTTWIDPDEIQYLGFLNHNKLNILET